MKQISIAESTFRRFFFNVFLLFFSIQLSGATNKAAVPADKSAPDKKSGQIAALQKEVKFLRSEIIKLWRLTLSLQRRTLTRTTVSKIARSQAADIVNRYLATAGNNPTRVPRNASRGNLRLTHLLVGNDRAGGEQLTGKGLRIAAVVKGPVEKQRNVFMAVYAVPVKDRMLRPEYLIHSDSRVPFLNGIAQTHFTWHGRLLNGKKAGSGRYKIFVRAILLASNGKPLGSAMRYWGAKSAASNKKYTVLIKK